MNPIRKIITALAVILSVVLLSTVSTAPAHAGYSDSFMWHQSPDEGFDDPITVYCENGLVVHLAEGEYSKYNRCGAVAFISVLAGRRVKCDNHAAGVGTRYYYPGVHKVENQYLELRCVHQLT